MNKKLSKISVIIPVYNRENYIEETLLSVLEQTYKNFEVILVDDGSTDRSQDIIKKYAEQDSRIVYIYQENNGVSSARNKGLDYALGQYIMFLDSDDLWEDSTLHKCINIIENNYNVDLVYFGYKEFDNQKVVEVSTKFATEDLLEDYLKNKVKINTNCFFINKDLIDRNNLRFTEGINNGEDMEFFAKVISVSNQPNFVEEYLNFRRIDTSNSISERNEFNKRVLDERIQSWRSLYHYLDNKKENLRYCKLIKGYMIPGLVIYGLTDAVNRSNEKNNMSLLYKEYLPEIRELSICNGLRSIKQWVYLMKLKIRVKCNRG